MLWANTKDDHCITALLLAALLAFALAFTAGACAREAPGSAVDAGLPDACLVELPTNNQYCPDPDIWNCRFLAETCPCGEDLYWFCNCSISHQWVCNREYDCTPCPGADAGL